MVDVEGAALIGGRVLYEVVLIVIGFVALVGVVVVFKGA